eukprot:TRINITY_DN63501_c0_g1_i1.p1 TRINITY_DN63501_c0_g1~~TRINITY_DN63501_c0_g1_i1.p1  ORF type:complete len:636 (-),score=131.57 TRINITY_DN63501_c0_g1_i1:73-1980(-)
MLSPRRRCLSVAVSAPSAPGTPPKTPGTSPRHASASPLAASAAVAGAGAGLSAAVPCLPGVSCRQQVPQECRKSMGVAPPQPPPAAAEGPTAIPFEVVNAVTTAIWSRAQAAAAAHGAASMSEPPPPRVVASPSRSAMSPTRASPLRKRRCELPRMEASLGDKLLVPAVALSQPSQASQTQPSEASEVEEAFAQACSALVLALKQESWTSSGGATSSAVAPFGGAALPPDVLQAVGEMALVALRYWREVSFDLGRAASSLACFLGHQRRLYWRRPPWRGVNLGGWLLLEPGPSSSLFERHGPASCEWSLMRKMREQIGDDASRKVLHEHRESFMREEDFRHISSLGLNAVRIPFGYWALMESAESDEYVGPCAEYVDRAVAWAHAHGLQVLLDLHGCPGGESGERPCGRENPDWTWQDWRFDATIEVLKRIAERFRGHPAVTGVSVCNEPSEKIPAKVLCKFYDRAVSVLREGGMRPDEVAVILPIYRTERLDEIWRIWNRDFDGFARHANVAFDLHLYHCFGTWWQRLAMQQHLRMSRRHGKILRRVPAVVGEWSLALSGRAVAAGSGGSTCEKEALCSFAAGQLEAYSQASHGWFFWNWRDKPQENACWDLTQCVERGWLSKHQFSAPAVKSS